MVSDVSLNLKQEIELEVNNPPPPSPLSPPDTSCLAPSKDLDGSNALLRTQEHRNALIHAFRDYPQKLRDEYGVVAVAIVSR